MTIGRLIVLLAAIVSANAYSGALWDRYEAWRQDPRKPDPLVAPTSTGQVIAVGLERIPDTVLNGGPGYEAVLFGDGSVRYAGSREVEHTGAYQGKLGHQSDFLQLAAFLCASDYFSLPSRLEIGSSDHPTSVLYVKTTAGEKWVVDPNFDDMMHPTIWALAKLIDQLLSTSTLDESSEQPTTEGLGSTAIAAPYYRLAEKLTKGEAATVVCFGDSVTGVYYHTGGRRAYTDMVQFGLQAVYPRASITAINAGISGNTTVNALARIDTDVLAHQPDLVTIMFGLNDMTRVPLSEYRANLKNMVARCREAGAGVVLCTPNNVRDTESRPEAKLIAYVNVVRDLALEEQVLLADCHATFDAIRERGTMEWPLLLSDEIHPNMAGHKRIAATILTALFGKDYYPYGAEAPQPAIPRTIQRIAAREPLHILAMPPYDALLTKILGDVAPASEITMQTWDVEGKSIQTIEEEAKGIRDKGYDLVFVAVPAAAHGDDPDTFIRSYSWILNYALSFGRQEWDVIAVPASLTAPVSGADHSYNELVKSLIAAQDFTVIDNEPWRQETTEARMRRWLDGQLNP